MKTEDKKAKAIFTFEKQIKEIFIYSYIGILNITSVDH